jgi:hypothetical protein
MIIDFSVFKISTDLSQKKKRLVSDGSFLITGVVFRINGLS